MRHRHRRVHRRTTTHPRTTSDNGKISRSQDRGQALEAARALDRARFIARCRWYRERVQRTKAAYHRMLHFLALALSATAVGVFVVSATGPDFLGWVGEHYEQVFKWLCGSVLLVALVGQIYIQTQVALLKKAAREEGIQIDAPSRDVL